MRKIDAEINNYAAMLYDQLVSEKAGSKETSENVTAKTQKVTQKVSTEPITPGKKVRGGDTVIMGGRSFKVHPDNEGMTVWDFKHMNELGLKFGLQLCVNVRNSLLHVSVKIHHHLKTHKMLMVEYQFFLR